MEQIKEKIKNVLLGVAKLWARFYNWLPAPIRVYVYSGSSLLFATWLGQLQVDLSKLTVNNAYSVAFVFFVTGLVNVIQKWITDAGTNALVQDGSKTTIKQLEAKVDTTQEILNKAP